MGMGAFKSPVSKNFDENELMPRCVTISVQIRLSDDSLSFESSRPAKGFIFCYK